MDQVLPSATPRGRIYGILWPLSATVQAVVSSIGLFIENRRLDHAEQRRAQHLNVKKGCAPPRLWAAKLPLGLDLLIKAFMHAKNRTLCHFLYEMLEQSSTTHEQRLLGMRGFGTSEPVNIEAILSKQFEDFDLGLRNAQFAPLLGDGIFVQSGPAWKHSRDMLRPQFMSNRYLNFEEIKKCVENLLAEIPADGMLDLQPLLFRLTYNTTIFLLFGQTALSLQSSKVQGRQPEFADAFTIGQEYLSYRSRVGNLFWIFNTPEFSKACQTTRSFVDALVQEALDRADNDRTEMTEQKRYVFINALVQHTRDRKALRDQCLNVLLAGRDTTACCITWTMRLLARHPRILSKLRAEISDIVGLGPGAPQPSREDLKNMNYLSLIIKETLRLYPPVPVNARAAIRATTLPVGGGIDGRFPVLVRKGESVSYCPYAMHRRKDIYGEDALEFRPERWEGNALRNVGYGYLPFNAGPRACLGKDFALLEASYTVARLVQRYPFITVPDGENIVEIGKEKQLLTLVLLCEEGCRVVLRNAEADRDE